MYLPTRTPTLSTEAPTWGSPDPPMLFGKIAPATLTPLPGHPHVGASVDKVGGPGPRINPKFIQVAPGPRWQGPGGNHFIRVSVMGGAGRGSKFALSRVCQGHRVKTTLSR